MNRFLRWLLPEKYSDTASCKQCGYRLCKVRMVRCSGYGWFCNEDHFVDYWRRLLW
jgi:hypothetical protein